MIVMKPMSSHTVKPSDLAPGVYWYMVPGKPAEICEKREGEAFARFINGRHQSWIRPGESFVGPFPVPETPGGEMEEGAATTFG